MNTTELLNLEEKIPNIFYIFVDMTSLVTKHNLDVTKSFFSGAFLQLSMADFAQKYMEGTVDYLPFVPNQNMDVKMLSIFHNNIISEYRTEYNCEIYRKHNFPDYPSRLSACYAFGDYLACKKVSKKYNWDLQTVKKFRLEPSPFNKVAKVNMEIVSLERYANRVSTLNQDTQNQIWNSYWTGHGEFPMELPTVNGREIFDSGVLWEYLIEGKLTLIED